jgi:hypothetical protein
MNQFTTNLGPQQGCDELNGRFADLYSGWVQADETWTYADANLLTISGDKTAKYQKGDKIKFSQSQAYTNDPFSGSNIELNMTDTSGFKIGNIVTISSSAGLEQTTVTSINAGVSITAANLTMDHTTNAPLVTCVKYAYITGVSYSGSNTTLTINVGSDYSLANVKITDNYYSKSENPQGFPNLFNYNPTYTASGSMTYTAVTTSTAAFKIQGRTCRVFLNFSGTTGGTAGTDITASLPVALSGSAIGFGCSVTDTAVMAGYGYINGSNFIFRRYDSANWGLGSGRIARAVIEYPI